MTQMISQNSISKEQLASSFLNLAHDKGLKVLTNNEVSLSFNDGTSVNYKFNREHTPQDIDKLNKIISTSYGENDHALKPVKYIAESLASFFHANGARVNNSKLVTSVPTEPAAVPAVQATGVLKSIIANLKIPSADPAVGYVVPDYVRGNNPSQVSLKELLAMPRKAVELKEAQTHYAKPPTLFERMRSGAGNILNSCIASASNFIKREATLFAEGAKSAISSIASIPVNIVANCIKAIPTQRLRVMCFSLVSFSVLGATPTGSTEITSNGPGSAPAPLTRKVTAEPAQSVLVAQLSSSTSSSVAVSRETETPTQTESQTPATTVIQEVKVDVSASEVIEFSFNAQGGNYSKNTNKADNFCKKVFGFSFTQLNPVRSTFKFSMTESAAKFIRSVNKLPKAQKLSLNAEKLVAKFKELMTPKTTVTRAEPAPAKLKEAVVTPPKAKEVAPSTVETGASKVTKEDPRPTAKIGGTTTETRETTAQPDTNTDLDELDGKTVKTLLLRLAGGNSDQFVPAAFKLACDLFVFTDSNGNEIKLEHKKMKEVQKFFSDPNRRFEVAPEIYKLAKIMEEKKIFSAVALRQEAENLGIDVEWKKFNAVTPRHARTSPSALASSGQRRTTPATSTPKIQGKVKTNQEILYEAITETKNDGGLFLSTDRAYRVLENGAPVAQLTDVRWGRDKLFVNSKGQWDEVTPKESKANAQLAALKGRLYELKRHLR